MDSLANSIRVIVYDTRWTIHGGRNQDGCTEALGDKPYALKLQSLWPRGRMSRGFGVAFMI
jgi:hypothetical protein